MNANERKRFLKDAYQKVSLDERADKAGVTIKDYDKFKKNQAAGHIVFLYAFALILIFFFSAAIWQNRYEQAVHNCMVFFKNYAYKDVVATCTKVMKG